MYTQTKSAAAWLMGFSALVLATGCVGAGGGRRGTDPALSSNAVVTAGGSDLGNGGSSNDLRPGERAPLARPTVPARALSVDVVSPHGPTTRTQTR